MLNFREQVDGHVDYRYEYVDVWQRGPTIAPPVYANVVLTIVRFARVKTLNLLPMLQQERQAMIGKAAALISFFETT